MTRHLEKPESAGPVKKTGHQEERQLSDEEGDDTETSSRAIELVELEIPGTQPR